MFKVEELKLFTSCDENDYSALKYKSSQIYCTCTSFWNQIQHWMMTSQI